MLFWLASQSSDRVSPARGWWTVPSFFGTSMRSSQDGNPRETSFWRNPGLPMPSGNRSIVIGRPRRCGSMMGATAS